MILNAEPLHALLVPGVGPLGCHKAQRSFALNLYRGQEVKEDAVTRARFYSAGFHSGARVVSGMYMS